MKQSTSPPCPVSLLRCPVSPGDGSPDSGTQSSHQTFLVSQQASYVSISAPYSSVTSFRALILGYLLGEALLKTKSFHCRSLTAASASFFSIRVLGDILAMLLFIACFLMSIQSQEESVLGVWKDICPQKTVCW